MKRFLTIISMTFALVALTSCNKENDNGAIMSYYMYNTDSKVVTGNDSTTDTSVITIALNGRSDRFDNMSESQAKTEWKSFVAAVDDSKVIIGTDQEYFSVSLIKINVYEKNEFETENKVVATVGKKTWRKSGAVEE